MHVQIRFGLLSITTPVTLLTNDFNNRCILHAQVSLSAVNHINVFHEDMNGYKKYIDSLKACFENVNIVNIVVTISFDVVAVYNGSNCKLSFMRKHLPL